MLKLLLLLLVAFALISVKVRGSDNPYPVDPYPSIEPTNYPILQYDAYPSVELTNSPSKISNDDDDDDAYPSVEPTNSPILQYDAYPSIVPANFPNFPDGPYPLETPSVAPTACPNFRGSTFSPTVLTSNTPSPQRTIEVETAAPQVVEISTESSVSSSNTCAPNGEQCALPFFPNVICSGCCINFGTFSECNDASFCNPTACLKEGEICGFFSGSSQDCCSGLRCKASFGISSCVTC